MSKKRQVGWRDELWFARRRMPFGLGYYSSFVYIWVTFGFEGGNQSSGAGWWPNRKFCRSGPNLPRGSIAKEINSMFWWSKTPIRESLFVVTEVDVLVLLVRPSFLHSWFCRCESALAVMICRTSEEVGLNKGLEGKELMVTSTPTVLEVQPWDVRGGEAGYGSTDRSKGREWGSDGR